MRKPIKLEDTTMDVVMKLAEGNPGAITVIMQLVERDDPMALMMLLNLDDMNMRGSQIWVGFKDHCKFDLETFVTCIKDRDIDMVNTVNSNSGVPERAVTSGGAPE